MCFQIEILMIPANFLPKREKGTFLLILIQKRDTFVPPKYQSNDMR